ncbi:ornithine cyclodeaminase family protein [Lactococcus cremoris]|uniref:Ornithine cyclodeaminase family protein n=1 Tax=Lactococcus lactis subsp. cremoris TaxID=1359 RepID=A0AAX4A4J3_LACLC|nr:ornithine cyclodeaminase family protein [Lactococcus cremoris]KGH33670.1 ornithine cyclodeaminase [Lactococcus cremoris]QSE64393.1 ornithine cyclodeaminase family protein [Lactococcus cremoris]WMX70077.1 ornithine cyclodeaminase family protein [Lactococcus cremoris]
MKQVSYDEVIEQLSFKESIQVMKDCFNDHENGTIAQRERMVEILPDGKDKNVFALMPAYLGEKRYFGAKIITAFPDNHSLNLPSHVGEVMLFDSQNGLPVALINANAITWIRTAAVSALATNFLAKEDSSILTLLGTGQQASSHLEAILCVRPIKVVRVYDLNQKAAAAFIERMQANHPELEFINSNNLREAVEHSDIVCTLTPSKEAFLEADFISAGTHINAIGTFTPTTRELKSELMVKGKVYVDDYEAALKESGDLLIPIAEGLMKEENIVGSLGELVTDKVAGRANIEEITIFDAVGLAVEDLCCAEYIYKKLK